ncbi:hypothetical protein BV326_04002 [Pseudomonas syringae pv. actinidiae]|uniref:hypothetical protein n=1 Tax=Pseudomonas syringae TaxID=317 RepID=UPI000A257416|nr:hypothetical protein [Pseudomonas syringae]OSR68119.1 hypothetical protein BV326_04002 [Pseudomonas syringae pv. actinidiae]
MNNITASTEECFWVRQTGYAELGLLAEKLALNLRSHCGMPAPKTNATGWSRTQTFVDVIESIKAKRSAFDHSQAGSSFETL